MPLFMFEINRRGRAPFLADTMLLPDCKAAWCHVEALALQEASILGREIGTATSIRVRNAGGDMVIQAGVGTALASIERCRASSCPLREEWEQKRLSSRHWSR